MTSSKSNQNLKVVGMSASIGTSSGDNNASMVLNHKFGQRTNSSTGVEGPPVKLPAVKSSNSFR